MVARLIAAASIAVSLLARVPAPSQFYVVSVFFSDAAPFYYFRVLDVKPEEHGSLVRYLRISAVRPWCPRTKVQSKEVHVTKTPRELLGPINPCAVGQDSLSTTIKRYQRLAGVFETISFGIVAQCGVSSFAMSLPASEELDLKRLKRHHPEMERLWRLWSHITDTVFGPADVFHDLTDTDDLELQRSGGKVVPDLMSGKYDPGLTAASGGESSSFRSALKLYTGIVTPADARAMPVPRLLNPEQYQFNRFVPPSYPRMALQARIQGKVELRVTVNNSNGEVTDVAVLSGHPLLKDPAVDAAKQWRFTPGSVGTEPVNVTVDFDLTCPSQ